MFAPAANAFSAALARTTVRTSGSLSASSRRALRASSTRRERTFTGGWSRVRTRVRSIRAARTRSGEGAIGAGDPCRPIYAARLPAARVLEIDDGACTGHHLVRDIPPRWGPYRTIGERAAVGGGVGRPGANPSGGRLDSRGGAGPVRARSRGLDDSRPTPRRTRTAPRPPLRGGPAVFRGPARPRDPATVALGGRRAGVDRIVGSIDPRGRGGARRVRLGPGPEPRRRTTRKLGFPGFSRDRPGRPRGRRAEGVGRGGDLAPGPGRPRIAGGSAPTRGTLPRDRGDARGALDRGEGGRARENTEPQRLARPGPDGPIVGPSPRARPSRPTAREHDPGPRRRTGVLRTPPGECAAASPRAPLPALCHPVGVPIRAGKARADVGRQGRDRRAARPGRCAGRPFPRAGVRAPT